MLFRPYPANSNNSALFLSFASVYEFDSNGFNFITPDPLSVRPFSPLLLSLQYVLTDNGPATNQNHCYTYSYPTKLLSSLKNYLHLSHVHALSVTLSAFNQNNAAHRFLTFLIDQSQPKIISKSPNGSKTETAATACRYN
jgi:hypothetical protein